MISLSFELSLRHLVAGVSNEVGSAPVRSFSYSHDLLGRPVRRIDAAPSGASTNTFSYNARSEVISSTLGGAATYAYDPAGNWTASSRDATSSSYAANALNQYESVVTAAPPTPSGTTPTATSRERHTTPAAAWTTTCSKSCTRARSASATSARPSTTTRLAAASERVSPRMAARAAGGATTQDRASWRRRSTAPPAPPPSSRTTSGVKDERKSGGRDHSPALPMAPRRFCASAYSGKAFRSSLASMARRTSAALLCS